MAECTVVEVYEIAASIGKELEKVIETYGGEAVAQIMPKIILSLEKLEAVTKKSEKHDAIVEDLTVKLETARKELLFAQEERIRSSQEWQESEEKWRDEAKDLLQMISTLQKSNEELKRKVTDQAGAVSHEIARAEEDHKVMYKLKEAVDRQRDEIRAKDRDLRQKAADIEALQSQIERLARLNHDLRRKQALVQHQATSLIDEKVELEAQMQALQQEIDRQDIEDHAIQQSMATQSIEFDPPINLEGKMIIDLKDPNRPRFTKEELKMVLKERIELKTQVFELEEQLSRYQSEENSEEDTVDHGSSVKENKVEEDGKSGNNESGIRKLFKFFSRGEDKKKIKAKEKDKDKVKGKEKTTENSSEIKPESLNSQSSVSNEDSATSGSSDDQEGKVEIVFEKSETNDDNETKTTSRLTPEQKYGATGPCSTDFDVLQRIDESEEDSDVASQSSSTSSGDWRRSRSEGHKESFKSFII
ncbi:RILP-like protein 1 [Ptychodera flava]|uniref:RILP-like protein 1 n=1 Tax=Ptychodera flava TaxID=63121 RepID=UPI00396A70E5